MHFEWKLKLRTHDASYYQIQSINKAGLTIVVMYFQGIGENSQKLQEIIQTLEKLTEQMRNMNLNKGNK